MIGYFPEGISWPEAIIGSLFSAFLLILIWLLSNYLQKKLDANRLQTRIDLKDYVILESSGSTCPNCGKTVFLIQPDSVESEGLSFYMCSCSYLGIVGKKRIK